MTGRMTNMYLLLKDLIEAEDPDGMCHSADKHKLHSTAKVQDVKDHDKSHIIKVEVQLHKTNKRR